MGAGLFWVPGDIGGLYLLAILFIAFIKVWFWMEMHSNRIVREVKRVELLFLRANK